MREYTVLLDPPVYTPGETASSATPVSAPTSASARLAGRRLRWLRHLPAAAPSAPAASPLTADAGAGGAASPAIATESARAIRSPRSRAACTPIHPCAIDQTMMAVYRANPDAFGGNINILRRGSVLRIPGADEIAALNQSEAISEVHRQMSAWSGAGGSPAGGHLRLVDSERRRQREPAALRIPPPRRPGPQGSSQGSRRAARGIAPLDRYPQWRAFCPAAQARRAGHPTRADPGPGACDAAAGADSQGCSCRR